MKYDDFIGIDGVKTHAINHTNGTDDIVIATINNKGLASDEHITAIENNTTKVGITPEQAGEITDNTTHRNSEHASNERSSHTGTQLANTISDFDTAVENNTSVVHKTGEETITGRKVFENMIVGTHFGYDEDYFLEKYEEGEYIDDLQITVPYMDNSYESNDGHRIEILTGGCYKTNDDTPAGNIQIKTGDIDNADNHRNGNIILETGHIIVENGMNATSGDIVFTIGDFTENDTGIGNYGRFEFNRGQMYLSTDTESSSTTTGAFVTNGGVGIAKNLNVGGDLDVAGSITRAGNTVWDESHFVKSIDGTLAGNSDTNVPSEKAVKTYVDANVGDSELEKLTEDGHTGWRLLGRDPSKHRDIGNDAIDLTWSVTSDVGASGAAAFAQNIGTKAIGDASHAEGQYSEAIGDASHAQGHHTTAEGVNSFSGGYYSTASGDNSLAFGSSVLTEGLHSVALGFNNNAYAFCSTIIGHYGIRATGDETNSIDPTNTLFAVGNGTNGTNRSNALTLKANGDLTVAGTIVSENVEIVHTDTVTDLIAVDRDYIRAAGGTTIVIPDSGVTIKIWDYRGEFGTTSCTLTCLNSTIMGVNSYELDQDNVEIELKWNGTEWRIIKNG